MNFYTFIPALVAWFQGNTGAGKMKLKGLIFCFFSHLDSNSIDCYWLIQDYQLLPFGIERKLTDAFMVLTKTLMLAFSQKNSMGIILIKLHT